MTEKLRPFYQLTVGRILIVEAAPLNGGEGLPCVGALQTHCRTELSPWAKLVAPLGTSGGTTFRNGQSAAQQNEGKGEEQPSRHQGQRRAESPWQPVEYTMLLTVEDPHLSRKKWEKEGVTERNCYRLTKCSLPQLSGPLGAGRREKNWERSEVETLTSRGVGEKCSRFCLDFSQSNSDDKLNFSQVYFVCGTNGLLDLHTFTSTHELFNLIFSASCVENKE